MNINYELPEEISIYLRGRINLSEILYSLPYDLNSRGSYIDGYIIITNEKIYKFEENNLIDEFDIKLIETIKAVDLSYSGCLEATINGIDIAIANYSMNELPRYMYIERAINLLLEDDFRPIETTPSKTHCSICGKPFLKRTHLCPFCSNRFSVFSRLIRLAAKNWYLYFFTLLTFGASSAILLYQPLINRNLIDNAIIPMSKGSIEKNISPILWFVLLIALCTLGNTLVGIARGLLTNQAGERLSRDLRHMVYDKLQKMSISYLEENKTGNLMNRINRDTGVLRFFIQQVLSTGLNEIFLLIGVAIVLFVYNWQLAILAIIPMPFVVIICYKFRIRMHRLYRSQKIKMDKLNSLLNDILNGIRVVKAFGQDKREVERFQNDAKTVRDLTTVAEQFFYTLSPTLRFIIGIGGFLVLLYGGSMVLHNKMTIGELLQFSTYSSYLYQRLQWFANIPRWINDAVVSSQFIFEILDQQPSISDDINAKTVEIGGDISFENVTFGYKSYQPVVRNINLEVKKGEMIGFVGHSGAGKSTMINLIMRLYDPDEGCIKVDGVDMRDISQDSYKGQIGVVLQETFLFSGSIIDNIRYAKPNATIDEVMTAAKIANAHDFIVRFPNGYDTLVGEKGHRVSGGERQRIAIARAVLLDPKILILDEATASVDTHTEQLIQDALSRVIKGRTTFAIAHRLSTLKNADRIVVMDKGKIAEVGTHIELIEKQGIYYGLVMAQKQLSAIKAV